MSVTLRLSGECSASSDSSLHSLVVFFFSSRRRHTRCSRDWSSDVCSSDLIIALHDSGQADDVLYYVMPYVEGESLRVRLNREKQLPLDDALQVAREVADEIGRASCRERV